MHLMTNKKKDFEEVLDMLETDEEAEIREANKEIKTKKNIIREDEKLVSDNEKTISDFKIWVNECVENPLFSLVILFQEDQKYFNDDINIREKIFKENAKEKGKTFSSGELYSEVREELENEEEKSKNIKEIWTKECVMAWFSSMPMIVNMQGKK